MKQEVVKDEMLGMCSSIMRAILGKMKLVSSQTEIEQLDSSHIFVSSSTVKRVRYCIVSNACADVVKLLSCECYTIIST